MQGAPNKVNALGKNLIKVHVGCFMCAMFKFQSQQAASSGGTILAYFLGIACRLFTHHAGLTLDVTPARVDFDINAPEVGAARRTSNAHPAGRPSMLFRDPQASWVQLVHKQPNIKQPRQQLLQQWPAWHSPQPGRWDQHEVDVACRYSDV